MSSAIFVHIVAVALFAATSVDSLQCYSCVGNSMDCEGSGMVQCADTDEFCHVSHDSLLRTKCSINYFSLFGLQPLATLHSHVPLLPIAPLGVVVHIEKNEKANHM